LMGPKTIGILPEKHGENMVKTWKHEDIS
jgi:hypothetical protein